MAKYIPRPLCQQGFSLMYIHMSWTTKTIPINKKLHNNKWRQKLSPKIKNKKRRKKNNKKKQQNTPSARTRNAQNSNLSKQTEANKNVYLKYSLRSFGWRANLLD